ncbi:hypothetical protein XENOCAPTIV_026843 [Xenoophorus captivus]|uniref:Uncharacterized protein n=1 Tax=Xenoophorus captivus TaxID=1517983 RepID=A0ABV0RDM4_9TELE
MGRDVPRLSLPGKLVFPSSTGSHFSMLGIGDIVMPGLLLCFVLRYDNYKKQATGEVPGPGNMSGRMQRVSYFHCTLIGYFVGKQPINRQLDVKDQGFLMSAYKSAIFLAGLLSFLLFTLGILNMLCLRRSADCHCGLENPSRCSARSALLGSLHPVASSHYGLPEGTFTG